ncbi:phosphoesterase [Halorubrum saccharovorum]|uniref:Phosphoesterase n=1 Tax=Halorubrum saccharovorum TaxID=2248 RepID=A0A0F8BIN4_9EURY|nr:phosphoesterase [Halorubrum saccharovorum]
MIDDQTVDYQRLYDLLAGSDSVVVVCHDNPDPDSLSSALALSVVAEQLGVGTVTIAYGGAISHQQNRAMVNALDIGLTPITECTLADFALVAFVDHSIPGRNNSVDEEMTPDIVIDHHPSEEVNGQYVDHRPNVGATATILTRYLQAYELELDERLATALLFGIHRETLSFTRETTAAEHAAASYLHSLADHSLIESLSNSVFTCETLSGIGDAIANREVRGSCLVSSLGRIHERDILPQAADYLLKLEGVSTTVVFGIVDDNIQLSARTNNSQLHIGELLKNTFDEDGSAGGHHDMAGGQIPLGLLGPVDEDDEVATDLLNQSVKKRLFSALDSWAES